VQDVLDAVLIIEAVILGLFVLLLAGCHIWALVDRNLNQRYLFCDIDPRCHFAFAWDKDGNGWIGNHLVLPAATPHKEPSNPFARLPTVGCPTSRGPIAG
jgi:hypothetical protein